MAVHCQNTVKCSFNGSNYLLFQKLTWGLPLKLNGESFGAIKIYRKIFLWLGFTGSEPEPKIFDGTKSFFFDTKNSLPKSEDLFLRVGRTGKPIERQYHWWKPGFEITKKNLVVWSCTNLCMTKISFVHEKNRTVIKIRAKSCKIEGRIFIAKNHL